MLEPRSTKGQVPTSLTGSKAGVRLVRSDQSENAIMGKKLPSTTQQPLLLHATRQDSQRWVGDRCSDRDASSGGHRGLITHFPLPPSRSTLTCSSIPLGNNPTAGFYRPTTCKVANYLTRCRRLRG